MSNDEKETVKYVLEKLLKRIEVLESVLGKHIAWSAQNLGTASATELLNELNELKNDSKIDLTKHRG